MKWLITGLNGTLAPVLAAHAQRRGAEVLAWRRDQLHVDDIPASSAWLQQARPDAIAHLAMGSVDWARRLAQHAAERDIAFVYTSTAMVFHHAPDGPHAVHDERNAQDGYGQYKRDCEDAVLQANPQACVVRLGWQIDPLRPGNNMLMALDQWQAKEGRVSASQAWKPACSFMEDSASVLAGLLLEPVPGVLHLDSNADEGHSFAQIVWALKSAFRREAWAVHEHQDYVHDQRLAGGGARVPPLSAHLPLLRQAREGKPGLGSTAP